MIDEFEAIIGDKFAITLIAGCGDQWITEALTSAKIRWSTTRESPDRWDEDINIMFVLRRPVDWYRDYLIGVSEGLGEYPAVDEEAEPVFKHLGKEPMVALNVAAMNVLTQQPGFLSVKYKMFELALLPVAGRVAYVEHDQLESILPSFIQRATGCKYDWSSVPPLSDFLSQEDDPELFEQAIQHIHTEEAACYRQFNQYFRWPNPT